MIKYILCLFLIFNLSILQRVYSQVHQTEIHLPEKHMVLDFAKVDGKSVYILSGRKNYATGEVKELTLNSFTPDFSLKWSKGIADRLVYWDRSFITILASIDDSQVGLLLVNKIRSKTQFYAVRLDSSGNYQSLTSEIYNRNIKTPNCNVLTSLGIHSFMQNGDTLIESLYDFEKGEIIPRNKFINEFGIHSQIIGRRENFLLVQDYNAKEGPVIIEYNLMSGKIDKRLKMNSELFGISVNYVRLYDGIHLRADNFLGDDGKSAIGYGDMHETQTELLGIIVHQKHSLRSYFWNPYLGCYYSISILEKHKESDRKRKKEVYRQVIIDEYNSDLSIKKHYQFDLINEKLEGDYHMGYLEGPDLSVFILPRKDTSYTFIYFETRKEYHSMLNLNCLSGEIEKVQTLEHISISLAKSYSSKDGATLRAISLLNAKEIQFFPEEYKEWLYSTMKDKPFKHNAESYIIGVLIDPNDFYGICFNKDDVVWLSRWSQTNGNKGELKNVTIPNPTEYIFKY